MARAKRTSFVIEDDDLARLDELALEYFGGNRSRTLRVLTLLALSLLKGERPAPGTEDAALVRLLTRDALTQAARAEKAGGGGEASGG